MANSYRVSLTKGLEGQFDIIFKLLSTANVLVAKVR